MLASPETVTERKELCRACPHLTKLLRCDICGCFMPAKTKMAAAFCPQGKWNKQ